MNIEKCYVHIVPVSVGFDNYGKGGNSSSQGNIFIKHRFLSPL